MSTNSIVLLSTLAVPRQIKGGRSERWWTAFETHLSLAWSVCVTLSSGTRLVSRRCTVIVDLVNKGRKVICTVTLWQDYCGKGNSGKFCWNSVGKKKDPNCECSLVNREKDYSCLCMWTKKTLAGKKQNIDPMWNILMKEVDLEEPISFLDHVYLGCTQRECQIRKDIVDYCRSMFESKISAGATEKLQRNLTRTYPHGPMLWKVMHRNAWKDIANWRTEQLNS